MKKIEFVTTKSVIVDSVVVEEKVEKSVVYGDLTSGERQEMTDILLESEFSYDGFSGDFNIGISSGQKIIPDGFYLSSSNTEVIEIIKKTWY